MSKINYSNQINYTGNAYLDSSMDPVENYASLMTIPMNKRFVGLEIVVLSDEVNSNGKQAKYWLKGGISNENWDKLNECDKITTEIYGESNTLEITVKQENNELKSIEIDADSLATTSDVKHTIENLNSQVSGESNGIKVEVQQESGLLKKLVIDNEITPSEPTLKNDLLVATKVGFLEINKKFNSGTTIEAVLTSMLCKELDYTTTNPTVTITNSGSGAGNYEIGSTISVILGHTYNDGAFIAENSWTQNIPAGCIEDSTSYYRNNTPIDSAETQTITNGTISYKCKTTYNASTATPQTSYGNPTTKSIPSGIATSSNISFTGYYKAYYVVNTATKLTASSTFNDCASICTSQLMNSNITVLGSTPQAIGDTTTTKYVYVLIPYSKTTPKFQNELGNEFTMAIINDNLVNNYNTRYKLCTTNINGHAGDKYKNCIITTN